MSYTLELIRKIEQYGFDREPFWNTIRISVQQGMVDDGMCEILLMQLEPKIEQWKVFPNLLQRPPDQEEFYRDGTPDIELGHLVERPSLTFGLRLLGRAMLLWWELPVAARLSPFVTSALRFTSTINDIRSNG